MQRGPSRKRSDKLLAMSEAPTVNGTGRAARRRRNRATGGLLDRAVCYSSSQLSFPLWSSCSLLLQFFSFDDRFHPADVMGSNNCPGSREFEAWSDDGLRAIGHRQKSGLPLLQPLPIPLLHTPVSRSR